jgi:flagellar hook-basal body complex protein FliE
MQGLESINLLNKGVGGFNPISDYNKTFKLEGMNLKELNDMNKTNQLNDSNMLQGQVQIDMPQGLDSIKDKELVSDLKEIMGNSARGGNDVSNSSPDKLYNSFQNALNDGIQKLDKSQNESSKNMETFATGGNIDIHTVMISAEKANLSMQLALQLKSKIIGAYKELSKIQV